MSGLITFLESPLVTWVKTFSLDKETVTFQDVSDPVYLLDVLHAIDERNAEDDVLKKSQRFSKDPNARLQNFAVLFHSITAYYLEVLQQAVVMKIPDVFSIVEDPTQEKSLAELEKLLLLLLGCAVQCDKKEKHIESIKCLDISSQRALVDCIKQVTDNGENVIALDSYGDSDDTKQLYLVTRRLVLEKDQLFKRMVQLKQERDYHANEVSKKLGELSPPPSLENYHLLRELQTCKAKVQHTQLELEEKGKTICDLKDELQFGEKEIAKVKMEKMKMEKDARLARTYRDEVDSLKEQALKAEKLEKELSRFKDKVHELDYYKSRVEELREDNSVLCECKDKLELQSHETQSQLGQATQEVNRLQALVDGLNKDKTEFEQKLKEALDENAALDFEKARMSEGYTGPLRRMVSYTSSEFLHASQQQCSGQPISDELSDSMSSHVTRLEVENGELKHELEQIKSKLYNTQQEVETLLNQSEWDYNNRLQGTDQRSARDRKYEAKLSELQNVLSLKHGELETFEGKLSVSERGRKSLERQVARIEEQWHAAQKQCEDMGVETKQLHRDLQEAKRTIRSMEGTKEQVEVMQRENKDLLQQTKMLGRELQEVRKKDEKQEIARLRMERESLIEQSNQLHRDLQESRKKASTVRDRTEEINTLQRDKESLMQQSNKLRMELQDARQTINSMQSNSEHVKEVQRDKEDLMQQFNALHAQITKEREQNISLQRDNNDFMQRLSVQQSHWDRDKEAYASIEKDKARLESENQQLKYNLDSLRECSDQHIKHLEEQIANLQDKSVAIENLNDYLNNLSMADSSQQVIDTDLDAHLDFSSTAKDSNHNNKSMCTGPDVAEWKSREISGPQCSTPQTGRRHLERPVSVSLCEEDQYAIDSSQLYGNDRPTKITYIKRNASFTASSQDTDKSGSNNFINKLKSYVKPSKPVSHTRHGHNSPSTHRPPLQEVQLREDSNFLRNSKHRSTVHGHSMVDKTGSLRRDKVRTPGSHSASRPVSASAFSRNHSLRQTMPERRRPTEYHHKSGQNSHNSSYHSQISQDSHRSHTSGQPPSTPTSRTFKDSDLDSGLNASSAEHLQRSHRQTDEHSVTSIEVTSTETVESHHWKRWSMKGSDKGDDRLKDKVRRLEDQIQGMSIENTELKKALERSREKGDDIMASGGVQKRLRELEAENRKLRVIVETLQNTLSGRNPYDDKEYHYFSNV